MPPERAQQFPGNRISADAFRSDQRHGKPQTAARNFHVVERAAGSRRLKFRNADLTRRLAAMSYQVNLKNRPRQGRKFSRLRRLISFQLLRRRERERESERSVTTCLPFNSTISRSIGFPERRFGAGCRPAAGMAGRILKGS